MAPAFVRGSYKVKFVLSILVIVLVVGAVGAVGYADVRDTVRSDTEETLRSASAADAEATSEGFGALAIHVVNFTTGTVYASTNQPLDGTPLSEIDEPWADPAALESVDPETIRTLDTAYRSDLEGQHVLATVGRTLYGDRGVVVVSSIGADSAQFSAAVSELAEDSDVGTLSMLRLRSLPESVNPAGGRG